MSAFAFVTGLFTLGLPAACVVRASGHEEDHRKAQRRTRKDGRKGGRRQDD